MRTQKRKKNKFKNLCLGLSAIKLVINGQPVVVVIDVGSQFLMKKKKKKKEKWRKEKKKKVKNFKF